MRTRAYTMLFAFAVAACGGGDPDGTDDEGDDDGLPGDDGGDDGEDDGGNGGQPDADFRVSGTVAAAAGLRSAIPGGGARVVDHVVAVAPSSTSQRRAYSTVGADGSFALDIDVGHAWVLVFVDSSRVGDDMIAGVLGAGALDTLTPTAHAGGGVDLGAVELGGSGAAVPGVSYDELLAALGLDAETADYLGALDDLCLRYINPDIDGDGVLDVLEPEDHHFLLDFHVQRAMVEDGVPATVADLVGRFLDPATTTSNFGGTGVYVTVPGSFWDGPLAEASLTFSDDLHYLTFLLGGGAGIAPAGTPVAGDALIAINLGDASSVGVFAAPGFDMPQGVYQADLGETRLTFTAVATASDAELASAEGTLLPFVRFAPADPACTAACTIASVDVEWRKRTIDGWILATTDELALTVGEGGGYASIVVGSENGSQRIGVLLPADAPTASLLWQPGIAHREGIDEAGFLALTTDQICHFGLSYDDRLGMRHFAGIGNAPGTCL